MLPDFSCQTAWEIGSLQTVTFSQWRLATNDTINMRDIWWPHPVAVKGLFYCSLVARLDLTESLGGERRYVRKWRIFSQLRMVWRWNWSPTQCSQHRQTRTACPQLEMKEVKFLIRTVLSLWFCGLTHLLKVSTGDFEVDKCSTDFPQFCPMQYEFLEFPVIPEVKEFCDETCLETTGHLDPRSLCWGFMVGMTSAFDQWKWKSLNRVRLSVTQWTVVHGIL